MNINLGGNTIVDGYFAGIVIPPGAKGRWFVVSANYAASVGDRIQANTSGQSITITLPATASTGARILIQDALLTWNTNNLIINRNGLNINGAASNYTANVVGGKLSVVYISTTYGWSIK